MAAMAAPHCASSSSAFLGLPRSDGGRRYGNSCRFAANARLATVSATLDKETAAAKPRRSRRPRKATKSGSTALLAPDEPAEAKNGGATEAQNGGLGGRGMVALDDVIVNPVGLGRRSRQVFDEVWRKFSRLGQMRCSMRQATLRAEDILNSWPELELGRILREYGEESNWQSVQKQIVKARAMGGLHSTGDLVKLIQRMCSISSGRQGWIKTATRVFQALRIAVNDELRVLEDSLHSCFDCLATGGRLAVISFHSLEDRIVKKTFLELIHGGEADDEEDYKDDLALTDIEDEDEPWFGHRVQGRNGTVLTKRPITPSQEEEKLNQRCRSAKLRVIQKT